MLARWRDAGGTWNYRSRLLNDGEPANENQKKRRQRLAELGSDFPVRTGLLAIRAYHQMRQTTGVARLIADLYSETDGLKSWTSPRIALARFGAAGDSWKNRPVNWSKPAKPTRVPRR